MTKKDFILIAGAIRDAEIDRESRLKITSSFARKLQLTNVRFDMGRFFNACMEE